MAKCTNPQALRMTEAVREVRGAEAAAQFEEQFPLSKSADIEKKFQWAKTASEYLETTCSEDELMKIRLQCRCNDGSSAAKRMLGYLKRGGSIENMVKLHNENEQYGTLEYYDEATFALCYPQCYCSCVKNVEGNLPHSWCYCTLGYARKLFEQVFEEPFGVELLESVKTGGKRCVVKIHLGNG